MLDYLAYGAIGIAMATTILTFRLLTSEQRKEQPNESILKMVKWFMGLTVFFSIFFGVIEILKTDEPTSVSVKTAAEYISQSDSSQFVLAGKPGSQEAAVFMNYGENQSIELGEISTNEDGDLNVTKASDKETWKVAFGKTILGNVKLEADEYRIIADSTHSKHFAVGEWYSLDESDFWFRINSISGRSPNYLYNVSYGEGRDKTSILPASRPLEYKKTTDGFIFLSQPFKHIYHESWKRQYYVKFGAGLATKGSTAVQKLNVQVVSLDMD